MTLLLCFKCHLTWASENPSAENAVADNHTHPFTIGVASDLHLDPEPSGMMVNQMVQYNTDIIDALFFDAINQKADILLLTGDITNAGGTQAHETLIRKLKAAKKKGLQTYVLPGNHDLTAGEADQFADLYQEFGYSDAYSRDTDSLSYSLLLNEGTENPLLILMLDTDGYTRRTNGAYLSEISLEWIENQLKQAADKDWQVLVAGHYSILTGQTTEFTGKEAFVNLLKKYQVPLYLCGHLHQRCVASVDTLRELVVDQVIAYPCSYALLQMEGDNEYRYRPRKIDVSAWAKETRQTSPDLLNFDEYQEKVFNERCEETVRLLKGKQYLSKKKTKQAVEFFRQAQQEYLQGTLPAHKKEIYKSAGYKAFMKIADGSTFGRWIPGFIENASPYTAGF